MDGATITLAIAVFTVLASNIVLFLWNRAEARTDARHFDLKLESNRKETLEIINAIRQDIKEFHNRLCVIEERRNKILFKE